MDPEAPPLRPGTYVRILCRKWRASAVALVRGRDCCSPCPGQGLARAARIRAELALSLPAVVAAPSYSVRFPRLPAQAVVPGALLHLLFADADPARGRRPCADPSQVAAHSRSQCDRITFPGG